VDPKLFVSNPTPDPGNFLEKKIFLYLNVHLVERLRILSEKFCFKFISDKGCPDPDSK